MPIQARLLQMRTHVAAYPQHLLLLRNTLPMLFVSDNDNDAPTSEFTAPIQTHNPLMHYEPDESSKGDKENAIAGIYHIKVLKNHFVSIHNWSHI